MTTNDLLKITRNNTYFPCPVTCNFSLICFLRVTICQNLHIKYQIHLYCILRIESHKQNLRVKFDT